MTVFVSPQDRPLVTFALLRLAPGAAAESVWASLAARPEFVRCEPLRGPWDLLVRCRQGRAGQAEEPLSHELQDGAIAGLTVLTLRLALEAPPSGGPRLLVLLDVDPARQAALEEQLGAAGPVVAAGFSEDGRRALVELAGDSFAALATFLQETLGLVEGVLGLQSAQLLRPEGLPPAGPKLGLAPLLKGLWRYRAGEGDLIPLLQLAQQAYGYVPVHAMEMIAGVSGVATSEIYGILTFYAQFRLQPQGRYVVRQCQGTACHVNGAKELQEIMEDDLGIAMGQTDPEGTFTLEKVACLGCCSLAPVLMVNEETHGRLDPQKLRRILKNYHREAQRERG